MLILHSFKLLFRTVASNDVYMLSEIVNLYLIEYGFISHTRKIPKITSQPKSMCCARDEAKFDMFNTNVSGLPSSCSHFHFICLLVLLQKVAN